MFRKQGILVTVVALVSLARQMEVASIYNTFFHHLSYTTSALSKLRV